VPGSKQIAHIWLGGQAALGDVYYLVPLPPSPLVPWNHRVGGNFLLRSLNPKDLQVKSFRNKDLGDFLVSGAGEIVVTYPLSNPRALLTPQAMKKVGSAGTTLLLSKLVPAYALRGIVEAKNAEMVARTRLSRRARASLPNQVALLHLANGMSVMCVWNFGDEKWPVDPTSPMEE
jgi:hypothetical protein